MLISGTHQQLRYKRPFDKGNLYVKFELEFPQSNWVDQSRLALLEQVLPPRNPLPPTNGAEVEEVVLSEIDPMHQQRSQYGNGAMDEDDEHGPSVQCAQS